MAHLDTAYKLGALQAQADFDQEIQKLAGPGNVVPPPVTGGTGVVNPGSDAGLAKSTIAAQQAQKVTGFKPPVVSRSPYQAR